jgi:predicted nucleotidyltransferase
MDNKGMEIMAYLTAIVSVILFGFVEFSPRSDLDVLLSLCDDAEERIEEITERLIRDKASSKIEIMTRTNHNDVVENKRRLETAKVLYEKIMMEKKTINFETCDIEEVPGIIVDMEKRLEKIISVV